MEDIIKYAITGFMLLLICCCFLRQRRYWREIKANRPSGSIRAGYKLAVITAVISLGFALWNNNDHYWHLFASVMLMTIVFCVKITFSPSAVAVVLAICTFQFYTQSRFPLYEVWTAFIACLSWRLPEEVRVAYASISFLWVLFCLLVPAKATSAVATDTPIDNLADTVTSWHA
jgi:hypothetical protein